MLQTHFAIRADGQQDEDLLSHQGREISALRVSLTEKQQPTNEIRERNAELEQMRGKISYYYILLATPQFSCRIALASRLWKRNDSILYFSFLSFCFMKLFY